jgi:PTH1 family peptidyl-tRNA hydrolase
MFAVFGLGNPGSKYLMNRHNVGYMVVDKMADDFRTSLRRLECHTLLGQIKRITGEDFTICKPIVYMNESGISVNGIRQKYHLALDQIIVVQDDLDLPLGTVRIKLGGGAGGHNGIRSIVKHLGDPTFIRVKIGIDRPYDKDLVVDYVLSDFTKREQQVIRESLETAIFAVLDCIDYGYLKAANKYNQKKN